ncbi:MAG: hypothetical protein LBS19_00865 [Clostridiales bacterium]|jgi:hypothetical protein|nr:hypothetical protein [Clostridiales bacterium]
MWCKHCKTVVPKGANKCPVCGAAIKNGKRGTYILLAVVLLAIIAGAVYLYFRAEEGKLTPPEPAEPVSSDTGLNPVDSALPTASPAAAALNEDPIADIPDVSPATEAQDDGQLGFDELREMALFDPGPDADPLFTALGILAEAVPGEVGYVTNKGYLYNYNAGGYVTAASVIESQGLDPRIMGFIPGKAGLLMLKGSDIQGILGLEGQEGEQQASEMFIAAICETRDGVAFAGPDGAAALSVNDINAVLRRYDTSHGTITRPGGEDQVYAEITRLAGDSFPSAFGYDIRYAAADEKYAVAVMTERSQGTLRTFVLTYTDKWETALSGLEYAENIPVFVNIHLADLDLNLLPGFDIKTVAYDPADEAAAEAGRLGAVLSFVSVSGGYAYAITENGDRYLGFREDGGWVPVPVADYREAEALLTERGAADKAYILLQE